ncbi:NAD(P)-dependent oxidoreductase [Pelagibacterales bacterium SAG-MED22]|nr:NAD(P)-dependent oxidoreductase [Pelagibacterales bacterium SAG-MED22]
MKKTVLVTGSTGFVGRQVISNLLDKKVQVRSIVRKGKESFFNDKNSKIQLVETKDLFEESTEWWKEQCKNIDTVIHIAWYAEPGKYLESAKNTDCLKGSLNLAKGAQQAGVRRFVGIGTCFEYELDVGDLSINTPLKPTTAYSIAKTELYKYLSQLLPSQSIEFCWCRLFYLYGDGEDERRLVPYLHKQLSNGLIAELSNGKQIRDFLDVSEAGRIIADVSMGGQQGPLNICSGIPISIRQLAEKIADKYGRRDLLKFGARAENIVDPQYVLGVPNF